jgi:hypothetical protein
MLLDLKGYRFQIRLNNNNNNNNTAKDNPGNGTTAAAAEAVATIQTRPESLNKCISLEIM